MEGMNQTRVPCTHIWKCHNKTPYNCYNLIKLFLINTQKKKKLKRAECPERRGTKGSCECATDGVDQGGEIPGVVFGSCLCCGKLLSYSEQKWALVQQNL
jgi:hypothetical protein